MRIRDWCSDVCSSDLLRKSPSVFLQALTSGLLKMRPDLLPWIEESPSGEHNFLPSCQALGDRHALARYLPDSDGPPFSLVLAIDDIDIIALFITLRSEEHTSELQSLMRISYAFFCLKKKKQHTK